MIRCFRVDMRTTRAAEHENRLYSAGSLGERDSLVFD